MEMQEVMNSRPTPNQSILEFDDEEEQDICEESSKQDFEVQHEISSAETLRKILDSRTFDTVIFSLIFVYAGIVFVSLSFQEELEDSLYELLIIEYIILILFVVEIALKTYAFQLKFLKDGWNIFDIIVVLVCFGLTTAELIDTDNVKSGIFKFTGFLRLLRIVVMFRKITEMRNI